MQYHHCFLGYIVQLQGHISFPDIPICDPQSECQTQELLIHDGSDNKNQNKKFPRINRTEEECLGDLAFPSCPFITVKCMYCTMYGNALSVDLA